MGSCKPNGDDCEEVSGGYCTMFVRDGKLHMEFEEETTSVSWEYEEAEFFYKKLGEAIEVMRDENKTEHDSTDSTDNKGG